MSPQPLLQPLLTVGHGTSSAEEFSALLLGADVGLLVDVRSYPGSRANPHMKREAMEQWLPESGVPYRWEPRLGGRRHAPKDAPTIDPWWQVEAFRAYAGYTHTPEWAEGLRDLLADVHRLAPGTASEHAATRVAVCCSETVWWRCHRRIIADVVSLTTDINVLDLAHDGKLTPHPVAEGARVRDDGQVVWDVA